MANETVVGVPRGWRRLPADDSSVLVSASPARTRGGWPAAQMVLRHETAGTDPIEAAAPGLDRLEVEDEDCYDLEGHQVCYRRFSHRHSRQVGDLGGIEVITDHWWWSGPTGAGPGISLSCSVPRELYADYCDVFEAIALTVRADRLLPGSAA